MLNWGEYRHSSALRIQTKEMFLEIFRQTILKLISLKRVASFEKVICYYSVTFEWRSQFTVLSSQFTAFT